MAEAEAAQRQRVEQQVELLLAGQGWDLERCDLGLEQSKPAALGRSVTYIVCAVIFNDKVAPRFLFLLSSLACLGLMCVCVCVRARLRRRC